NQTAASIGQTVTFAAAASGIPAPTVQWQVSTNGGGTWADIAGGTSARYTFAVTQSQNGNPYRAGFADPFGKHPSNAAILSFTHQIIDDSASGFSMVGAWTADNTAGYQGNGRYAAAGHGEAIATWTFQGLATGQYYISATWTYGLYRADNATYS